VLADTIIGPRMRSSVAVVLLITACGAPPADPPSAVISARPSALCEGDDFQTVVSFTGRESSPRLTLVPSFDPDEPPLQYAWTFYGAEYEIVAGNLGARDLDLVTSGLSPLHAELTVTNGSGGEATVLLTLSITPRGDPPSGTCGRDADCGPCYVCALESQECVSP
jgi:hypothetical protein